MLVKFFWKIERLPLTSLANGAIVRRVRFVVMLRCWAWSEELIQFSLSAGRFGLWQIGEFCSACLVVFVQYVSIVSCPGLGRGFS